MTSSRGSGSVTEFQHALVLFERAANRAILTCQAIPTELWQGSASRSDSFADVLEHMAIANELTSRRFKTLIGRESDESFSSSVEDDEIPHLFWRAPEPPGLAVPTGTWNDQDEAIERFRVGAASLAELAKGEYGDMRRKGDRHPIFGFLDGVQWALFAAAHTERHRAGILGQLSQPIGGSTL
jgi:DinB superfamily